MRYRLSAPVLLAALSCSFSSAAHAEDAWRIAATDERAAAMKWEVGYLALSAVDAAQTIECLNRHQCDEANPILGKHTSAFKIIAAKVGFGLVHFWAFNKLNEQNPHGALRAAQLSAALQGGVVLINARIYFR